MEGTLELLKDEYEKVVIKHEIMEEKVFINHNYVFLVLCEEKEMFIVGCD